jgi:hypothetical protein
VGEDQDAARDRVSIQEAARRLGVKEDAIRERIQRGTFRHEKTDEGRVFVWVDKAQDTTENTHRDAAQDALLDAKGESIATFREQLQAERQAHAESRRLLVAALERMPPQLEAPLESSELPVTATDVPDKGEGHTPGATDGHTEALVEEDVRRLACHTDAAQFICLRLLNPFLAPVERVSARAAVALVIALAAIDFVVVAANQSIVAPRAIYIVDTWPSLDVIAAAASV